MNERLVLENTCTFVYKSQSISQICPFKVSKLNVTGENKAGAKINIEM